MREDYEKALALDAVASEFEQLVLQGKDPRIESYLDSNPQLDQSELLAELLAIEIEVLRSEGKEPSVEEYRRRFGDYQAAVDTCFRADDDTVLPATTPALTMYSDELPDIPGYEVLQKIGEGGMGVVYKARQLSPSRIVALKMIRSATLATNKERERFQAEANAVAKLDHPNIVPLMEVGEFNKQPYLTMPFVEGETLSERISRSTMNSKEAAKLIGGLAEAVQHAHDQGLIHRDIKPGNVLLNTSGSPRLTDFGLASEMDAQSQLTRTGEVLGTPSFMAPEQAAGKNSDIGPATDVYALGAVLYFVLTGRPPHQGSSPLETMNKVLNEEPLAPRSIDRSIAKDVETISLNSLQKQVDQRFSSATELSDDLKRYLGGKPIQARPATLPQRVWKWVKRNPWQAAALALTLLMTSSSFGAAVFLKAKRDEAEAARQIAETERQRAEVEEEYAQSMMSMFVFKDAKRLAKHDWYFDGMLGAEHAGADAITPKYRGLDWKLALASLSDRHGFSEASRLASHHLYGFVSAQVSPDGANFAYVDGSAALLVCDAQNGEIVHEVFPPLEDFDERFGTSRELHLVEYLRKDKADRDQREVPTCVSWAASGSLLVGTLNGKCYRYCLDEQKLVLLGECDKAVLGITERRGVPVAASESGQLVELGADRKVLAELESAVTALHCHGGRLFAGTLDGGVHTLPAIDGGKNFHQANGIVWGLDTLGTDAELTLAVAPSGSHPEVVEFKLDGGFGGARSLAHQDLQRGTLAVEFAAGKILAVVNDLEVTTKLELAVWDEEKKLLAYGPLDWDTRLRPQTRAALPLAYQRRIAILQGSEDGFHVGTEGGLLRSFVKSSVTGESIATSKVGNSPQIEFDESGDLIWAVDGQGAVSALHHTSGKKLAELELTEGDATKNCDVRPISMRTALVCVGSKQLFAVKWDGDRLRVTSRFESTEPLVSFDFSLEKGVVYGLDAKGRMNVWDLGSGKLREVKRVVVSSWLEKVKASLPTDRKSPIATGCVRVSTDSKRLFIAANPAAINHQVSVHIVSTIDLSPTGEDFFGNLECLDCEWGAADATMFAYADSAPRLQRHSIANPVGKIRISEWPSAHQAHVDIDRLTSGFVSVTNQGAVVFHSPLSFIQRSLVELSPQLKEQFKNTSATSVSCDRDQTKYAIGFADGRVLIRTVAKNQSKAKPLAGETVALTVVESGYHQISRIGGSQHGLAAVATNTNSRSTADLLLGSFNGGRTKLTWERVATDNARHDQFEFSSDPTTVVDSQRGLGVLARHRDYSEGNFNGNLLWLCRDTDGWASETVVRGGNSGFFPVPYLDEDGNLSQVLHFSFGGYRLLVSDRNTVSEKGWETKTLRFGSGSYLDHVQIDENLFLSSAPYRHGRPHLFPRKLFRWDGKELKELTGLRTTHQLHEVLAKEKSPVVFTTSVATQHPDGSTMRVGLPDIAPGSHQAEYWQHTGSEWTKLASVRDDGSNGIPWSPELDVLHTSIIRVRDSQDFTCVQLTSDGMCYRHFRFPENVRGANVRFARVLQDSGTTILLLKELRDKAYLRMLQITLE